MSYYCLFSVALSVFKIFIFFYVYDCRRVVLLLRLFYKCRDWGLDRGNNFFSIRYLSGRILEFVLEVIMKCKRLCLEKYGGDIYYVVVSGYIWRVNVRRRGTGKVSLGYLFFIINLYIDLYICSKCISFL